MVDFCLTHICCELPNNQKSKESARKLNLPSSFIEYVFVCHRLSDLLVQELSEKALQILWFWITELSLPWMFEQQKDPLYGNQSLLSPVLVTSDETGGSRYFCVCIYHEHYIYIPSWYPRLRKHLAVPAELPSPLNWWRWRNSGVEKEPFLRGRQKGSLLLNFSQDRIVSNKTFTSL